MFKKAVNMEVGSAILGVLKHKLETGQPFIYRGVPCKPIGMSKFSENGKRYIKVMLESEFNLAEVS